MENGSCENEATINLPPSFPQFIRDIPAKAAIIIIRLMNMKNTKNWKDFAAEAWPNMSMRDIISRFEAEKMESVLEQMGFECETTVKLFQILIKIERRDVIVDLQKEYPSLR